MNWTAIKGTLTCITLTAVTYLSVTAAIAVHTLEKHASKILMNADDSITQVNKTLDRVNSKGGTLQQVDESVVRVKDLITLTQATLYKQQSSIASLDVEVQQSLENLNYVLHTANTLMDTTSDSEKVLSSQASLTLVAAQNSLIELQRDEENADIAITDFTHQMDELQPVVHSTLNNTDTTMANVAASTTDVKNFIHKETTPKKLTFWGGMEAGAVWAHKILMPSIF